MLGVRKDVHWLKFGCYLKKLSNYQDARGHLTPLFQDTDEELVMAYTSTTYAGEARDADQWHVHRYQTDRFVCMVGKISFAISDGFETFVITMEPTHTYMLYIPPNVYHCFKAHYESIIINFPTMDFDPDDEGRVPFSELEAPRPW